MATSTEAVNEEGLVIPVSLRTVANECMSMSYLTTLAY